MLGVNFASDINNIWELNQQKVLNKAENICKQWAKRKLALIGRITNKIFGIVKVHTSVYSATKSAA